MTKDRMGTCLSKTKRCHGLLECCKAFKASNLQLHWIESQLEPVSIGFYDICKATPEIWQTIWRQIADAFEPNHYAVFRPLTRYGCDLRFVWLSGHQTAVTTTAILATETGLVMRSSRVTESQVKARRRIAYKPRFTNSDLGKRNFSH